MCMFAELILDVKSSEQRVDDWVTLAKLRHRLLSLNTKSDHERIFSPWVAPVLDSSDRSERHLNFELIPNLHKLRFMAQHFRNSVSLTKTLSEDPTFAECYWDPMKKLLIDAAHHTYVHMELPSGEALWPTIPEHESTCYRVFHRSCKKLNWDRGRGRDFPFKFWIDGW